jgi:hypothetical protein
MRFGLKPFWLVFFIASGLGAAAVAIASCYVRLWWGIAFFGALAAACFALARTRVELDEEAVTVFDGFRTRRMSRVHILGRRNQQFQYGIGEIRLSSSVPGEKPLKVPNIAVAGELARWLSGLPDLDGQERQQSQLQLEGAHGAQTLALAWRRAKLLNAAVMVTMLWAVFFPRPYHLALLANVAIELSAMTLLLCNRGVYAVDSGRNEATPSLGLTLFGPGMALALRMFLDTNLLPGQLSIVFAVAGAAVLTYLLAQADDGRRRSGVIGLAFLLQMPLAWGLAVYANTALDRSQSQTFQSRVLKKFVERNKVTTYELTLSPWGPQQEVARSSVPRAVYDQVKLGGEVRVQLRAGSLGMPWFEIDPQ